MRALGVSFHHEIDAGWQAMSPNTFAGGIYVVEATNGREVEYWAAATSTQKRTVARRRLPNSRWTRCGRKEKG
jgi:hypothetical protein